VDEQEPVSNVLPVVARCGEAAQDAEQAFGVDLPP
jgi:hypothetical protein